ncbi:MAG TPA: glycoside hydrolase family 3 protein [Myxococcota bacterium]
MSVRSLLLAVALVVTTLLTSSSHAATSVAAVPAPWSIDGVDVGAVVAGMNDEQKVGQLLLLGFGGTAMDDTISSFLEEMQPGGVALFSRNVADATTTMRLIRDVRTHDPRLQPTSSSSSIALPKTLPMFVAVDQEGGSVVRLKDDAVVLPSAMALGAADDPQLARTLGQVLGRDLLAWGFNMNLAPVLDVSSNPKNPVIGVRSFGGDPQRVGEVGVGYINGLVDVGVVPVAKHFPGHGDTDTDSHYALPVLQHDRARLDAVELWPFARAFSAGLPAMMTAHIALPKIAEGKDIPATVSGKVITGVLREELGYDGLVITDGLEMQGIVDRYGAGEAAVRAVVAGADMVMVLWFPEKKREVRRALLEAVASGRLSRSRLDQAVRRVLEQKAKAGLFSRGTPSIPAALQQLKDNDRKVVGEVARKAITLVKNADDVVPVKGRVVVAAAPQGAFLRGLEKRANAKTLQLPWAPTKAGSDKNVEQIVAMAESNKADVVVIGLQSADHAAVVRGVKARVKVPVVVVSFGSPWLISGFSNVDGYVCAFGWRDDSAAAAAAVVAGDARATGVMPVRLSGSTAGSK